MSRHLFDTTLEANPIRVIVGYDRPTDQFYLCIGWIDQAGNVLAYASDLKLAYDPKDVRSIRRFLTNLGITVPESMWTEVVYDSMAKIGGRVVRHLSDGTTCELIPG